MRCRCLSPNARDPSTFHDNITRVEALFACCPPGPPDGLKDNSSSSPGIVSERVTLRSSGIR
jgi:hypothetical protein